MNEITVDLSRVETRKSKFCKFKTYNFLGSKVAQVSIYIIIAVVLIIVTTLITLVVYNSSEINDNKLELNEFLKIEDYIKLCVQERVEEVLPLLAIQGGYLALPETEFFSEINSMAYGYKDMEYRLPSRDVMSNHLSHYIGNTIDECYELDVFENQGYIFQSQGAPEYEVVIHDNTITVHLDIPIKVTKQDKEYLIDKVSVSINSKLGAMHRQAERIVDIISKDPEYIPISEIAMLEYNVDMIPHNDTTMLYSIVEDEEKIDSLVFMFAVQNIPNSAPIFNVQTYFVLSDGQSYNLTLTAYDKEGDSLEYRTNTSMFNIDEKGIASFTPEIPGIYNIEIEAIDEYYNRAKETIVVEVMAKR